MKDKDKPEEGTPEEKPDVVDQAAEVAADADETLVEAEQHDQAKDRESRRVSFKADTLKFSSAKSDENGNGLALTVTMTLKAEMMVGDVSRLARIQTGREIDVELEANMLQAKLPGLE